MKAPKYLADAMVKAQEVVSREIEAKREQTRVLQKGYNPTERITR